MRVRPGSDRAVWIGLRRCGCAYGGIPTRLAIRSSIFCRRLSVPMCIVASAEMSMPVEKSEMQTAGMREPEARSREHRSWSSAGMELSRRTRSKLPSGAERFCPERSQRK